MPFIAVPDVVLCAPIWSLDNQPCENTFHYLVTGAIDEALCRAIAQTYIDWAGVHSSFFSTNAGLTKVYVRDLSAEDSFSVDVVPDPPVDGTNPGAALANNVTWAIKRTSGLAGRKNRGRIYQIGLSDDQLADPNHIAPGTAGNMVNGYNSLLAAQVADNGAQEVLVHAGTATTVVISTYEYADLTLDSQRRRLPDHNRHH